MSQPFESEEAQLGPDGGAEVPPPPTGDTEEIDALPVLADEPKVLRAYTLSSSPATYWRSTSLTIPAVQAAAVAAGGFVAGAAVARLAGRRHRRLSPLSGTRRGMRGSSRRSRGASKAGELVQIVGSRSLLVDVHLLGGRGGT